MKKLVLRKRMPKQVVSDSALHDERLEKLGRRIRKKK